MKVVLIYIVCQILCVRSFFKMDFKEESESLQKMILRIIKMQSYKKKATSHNYNEAKDRNNRKKVVLDDGKE